MTQFPQIASAAGMSGRIGWIATVVLVLIALALYLFSERAVPPEPAPDAPVPIPMEPREPEPDADTGDEGTAPEAEPADAVIDTVAGQEPADSAPVEVIEMEPAPIDFERQAREMRAELSGLLEPEQAGLLVENRLIQRAVATLNSLDGDPVPLRFRPIEHVPGLPKVETDRESLRLPDEFDERYAPYWEMFQPLDVGQLAELFDRHEPALEQAWQAMGEERAQTFRERAVEVLRHLARFKVPARRPELVRPEVLYKYADPQLEALSWGRKVLVRIGPERAEAVQRKLDALADRLAGED